jgi:uncharacterized protein (DUF1810 family)
MEPDPFNLERFTEAQSGVYEHAVDELRRGLKTSHWMWFVFPQIAGLGQSATSRHFAIGSLAEGRAYLAHPVLGQRLRECASILARGSSGTADQIFGGIDAVKLRSSMTLFQHADPSEPLFRQVLDQYFDGAGDPATEERL